MNDVGLEFPTRAEKRSLVMSMCLGDGCLYHHKKRNKEGKTVLYGGFAMDHGTEQSDYIRWKAELLSKAFSRDVVARPGHKGRSVQCAMSDKRFRAWRKFVYRDGKKDKAAMTRLILKPDLALAIWLMDDGYVEPSIKKGKPVPLAGARLRLFGCHQANGSLEKVMDWIGESFPRPRLFEMRNNKRGKTYLYLKWNTAQSLEIWERLRGLILSFDSMKHKFRHLEEIRNRRRVKRPPHDSEMR